MHRTGGRPAHPMHGRTMRRAQPPTRRLRHAVRRNAVDRAAQIVHTEASVEVRAHPRGPRRTGEALATTTMGCTPFKYLV